MAKKISPKIILGGFGDDAIAGTDGKDIIFGLFGDDSISSAAGDDKVFAGFGDDTITGGAGDNRYHGGHGDDLVSYAGSVDDYQVMRGRFPWQPITVERLDTAPEGAGTDRLQAVEKIYFAVDDYTLMVDGSNNAVLARDDSADATEDGSTDIAAADLLANDLEFDGDAITITSVSANSAAGAAVSLAGGVVSYDPGTLFDGLKEGETATDTFTYTVDDGKGGIDTAIVTVTIHGSNDAPVIAAPTAVEYAENGTEAVAFVSATDVDGDALVYAISGGADAALFAIDASTGVLSFIAAPDYEAPLDDGGDNIYDVEVSVTDGIATDSAAIAVTVTDVDEGPAPEYRINELHYDDASTDDNEFVEVRVTAGADISGVSVELYNQVGVVYGGEVLSNMAMTTDGTWDYYVFTGPTNLIQNGANDGLALIKDGVVLEFLSYEGTTVGADGTTAAGLTSTDIGVAEAGEVEGNSLWRDDAGLWHGPDAETAGAANEAAPVVEARLNELHYDNDGADVGEFVEVRVTAGADVSAMLVELYNGSGGAVYQTLAVGSGAMTTDGTWDYYVLTGPSNLIQNGSPDGFALSNDGAVVEFFSYEGTMTAVGGTADGMTSVDIGVSEASSTPIGQSLWRDDAGVWQGPADETPGSANEGAPVIEARLNELHYDNAGADVGEFVEVRVTAGGDVTGYAVELYNGSGGAVYDSADLSAMAMTTDGTWDYYVWSPSSIQNGAPDGVALAGPDGNIEFFSYEGTFTAVGGSADGLTSVDLGVEETSSTAEGDALWRDDAGVWQGPAAATAGAANEDGGGGGGGEPGEVTLISAIQGETDTSAYVGQTVTVEAIVVGDFQDGDADTTRDLRGFWLQEETTDSDGNVLTSEGIYVYEGAGTFLTDVAIGDKVKVTGSISEYFGETQLSATSVEIVQAGAVADVNTMAAHISLDAINDVVVDQGGDYVPDLEAYEGMLVTIDDTLTVNELFQLDRFNEMRLTTGDRPQTFTQFNDPDPVAYDAYQQSTGSDQIVYDDGLNFQNQAIIAEADLNGDGVFNTADGFGMGDTVTGLTGVLNYGWAGNASSGATYRIRGVEDGANVFVDTEVRDPVAPDVGGALKVVSFNVLNYFTTVDVSGATTLNGFDPRGADTAEELARQTDKLVDALVDLDADVFGLVELENDFTAGSGNAIAHLVAELNATLGGTIYDWVNPGVDHVGDDAIAVGMIYKVGSVSVVPGTVDFLTDADLDALGYGALDDDGLGVFTGANTNRSPLTAEFIDLGTGEDFSVTVVHLKSKGGTGEGGNLDVADGAGSFDEMRQDGVNVITDWLATAADEDSLVLGDFNAYGAENPIDLMLADGFVNLEENFNPGATTYVFDGQTGTLDYAFGSAGIMDNVTGAEAWNINSNEPDAIDYNLDFGRDPAIYDGDTPYRTSDHDPIVIGLDFSTVDEFVLA